MSAPVQKSP